jgi:hypothetical protein
MHNVTKFKKKNHRAFFIDLHVLTKLRTSSGQSSKFRFQLSHRVVMNFANHYESVSQLSQIEKMSNKFISSVKVWGNIGLRNVLSREVSSFDGTIRGPIEVLDQLWQYEFLSFYVVASFRFGYSERRQTILVPLKLVNYKFHLSNKLFHYRCLINMFNLPQHHLKNQLTALQCL